MLLAAEASYKKSRAFLEMHGSSLFAGDEFIDTEALAAWPEWSASEADRIRRAPSSIFAALGAPVSVLTEQTFPDLGLAEVCGAFYQGDLGALDASRVAIVGTRKASLQGKAIARKFGSGLAKSGVTVVSGGAYGIDAAAHEGALAQEGRTVAVLASGLDKLYPPAHRSAFHRIAQTGGLVTAYAFGSKLRPDKFLERNSLISALSNAVLVIEAPERSGALSTLRSAQVQGRSVYAVPGEGDSFAGSMLAIEEGLAEAITEPSELLERLGVVAKASAPLTTNLGELILANLKPESMTLETLADATGVAANDLLSELTMLEIEGLIVRAPGGFALVP